MSHVFTSMADSISDVTDVATVNQENNLSKRAQRKQKRLVAKERRKELKKLTKGLTKNKDPGFDNSLFSAAEYYFENGLRKVYPYYFTFSTFAKERWIGKTALEVFLQDFHGTETEEYIDAIESGKVKIGGIPVSLDYKIKNNDFLEHTLHRHENPVVGTPLEIIADDKDVIVINKPASIPCHPCGRYRFNSIAFILGKEYGYPNLRNLYRLDRLTSGVLILGKTAEATRKFEDHIAGKRVRKEYVCRVVGEFPEGDVVCDQPLEIIDHKITLFKVKSTGKQSKTIFRRLSYNGKTSVVKCFPLTGRTHQIRVHLQYLGYPIMNDPMYNSPAFGPNRGKGGEFWKPEKEMMSEIQNLHNIGLWFDGENPFYHKRLKEISDSKSEQNKSLPDNEMTPSSKNGECSDSVDKDSDVVGKEPQAKRIKVDSTDKICIDDEKMCQTKSEKLSKSDLHLGSGIISSKSSSEGETDAKVASYMSSETFSNVENQSSSFVATDTCSQNLSQSNDRVKNIQYAPFDESKWIPDEKCTSCKRNYIDPAPSHLVMFLHALSYKGPDWEYSTELPDWAKDDWEDNITKEETTQK